MKCLAVYYSYTVSTLMHNVSFLPSNHSNELYLVDCVLMGKVMIECHSDPLDPAFSECILSDVKALNSEPFIHTVAAIRLYLDSCLCFILIHSFV